MRKQNLLQQSIEWYTQHSWIPVISRAADYPFWMSNVHAWTVRMSIMKFSHISWNNSIKKICENKTSYSNLSNDIVSINGSLLFLPVLNVQCPMSNELRMSIIKFSHISWKNYMKKICGNKTSYSSQLNDIVSIRGSLLFLALRTTRSECPMTMHERCECPLWNFRIFLERILWKKYVETKHPKAVYQMIYSAFVDLCYFWRCRLPVLNVQCPCMNTANVHYEIFAYFLKEFYERNMWKQNLPQHSIEWYSQH